MTTGTMGDDEGLLTEQDAAELLQVEAVDAPPLAPGGHRTALPRDWPAGALPAGRRRTMADRHHSGRLARGVPVAPAMG
jgi:hypothetical protein